jgi:mono/diheme cytochrome c family protein
MLRRLYWVVAIAILSGVVVGLEGLRPRLPSAERGRRLAEQLGCFGCHGPGGKDRTVPTFGGDLMMYAKSPGEVAEWIRDGVTTARRGSRTWRAERDRGALRMPAYGSRLERAQIDDLVAFVLASAGDETPGDSLAAAGLERADALGCFGCHGPGGRFARPNPGSLKGYIPSWDGEDFPELVRNREEFDAWVDRGIPPRFEHNPFARHFLRRATVIMPGFRDHLDTGDRDALWAYVTWLRRGTAPAPETDRAAATDR